MLTVMGMLQARMEVVAPPHWRQESRVTAEDRQMGCQNCAFGDGLVCTVRAQYEAAKRMTSRYKAYFLAVQKNRKKYLRRTERIS